MQLDLDGGATKLLNVIDGIVQDQQNPQRPIDSSNDAAAPALRTSGLSLVRAKYADTLMGELAQASEHENRMRTGETVELFAEDLVRGCRFDVRRFPANFPFDSDTPPPMPPWLSLHRRTGNFVFHPSGATDLMLSGISDEGFLQPSYAQNIDDPALADATSPIFIHESICHWQGWSLSAARPADPIVLGAVPPGATGDEVPMLTQVDVTFAAVPGTLPRLRFGDFYQLRARTVDLAGNGPTVDEANDVVAALATGRAHIPVLPIHPQEFRYRRFEPIPAPVLAPRSELTEGEALDVLVIRSNGSSAAAYAASLHNPKYSGVCERHVVPPKSSQVMIEMHGLLDGAFGSGADSLRFFKICQRESGTLNDSAVVNVETGALEQLPDVTVVDPNTGVQTLHRNGISFVAASTGMESQTAGAAGYAIHYESQLRIPYLPDPLARGASLFGLPGVVGQSAVLDQNGAHFTGPAGQLLPQKAIYALGYVTKVDFGRSEKWWEPLPFRLRLDETGSPDGALPQWDPDPQARVLTVRLAPGETRTVWLSSFPDPGDLALFGLHASWSERLGGTAEAREFLGTAPHGALNMLTPAHRLTLVHAIQQPLIAPADTPLGSFGIRRFENDTVAYITGGFTIHGLSTAKIDLFAIWTEPGGGPGGSERRTVTTHVLEFPIHLDGPSGSTDDNPVPIGRYDNDVQLVRFFTPGTAGATVGKRWLARHEFGDTKFRNVTYRVVATTRYREYFPDQIASSPDNLTRWVQFQKIVPSTAPPPAPEISYIVPAFQWLQDLDPSTAEVRLSHRRGGALRVYLGASWHASGEGEQLAIVGSPDWGEDPIHSAPVQTGGSVEPSVGVEAGLFPYPVDFDTARGLWFCDLTFDVAGLYFPFVKLTLARYQSNSLPGLSLSPTVEAGIYQLTPDRTVVLSYQDTLPGDPSHRRIDISVQGDAALAAQLAAATRSVAYSVEVTVERRAVPQTDDDLGWTPASVAEQPVPDTPAPGQPALWAGHVLLPRFADGERRIVVKEFEIYEPNSCQTGQSWIGDAAESSRRLVYADAIAVF